jgi:hypothetical protein
MINIILSKELFKPQQVYSSTSTKQIFEKLAHSSIMRLNKNSMDKLYDLMTMGFKRQIISCNDPQQYFVVTLNHLESIRHLVNDPNVDDLIQVAVDKTVETYSQLNPGQWLTIKYTMMRFFQDKKVKVSLFLQQSLQVADGFLVLSNDGKLPAGTEMPGTIRFYEGGSVEVTRSFEAVNGYGCVESIEPLDLECTHGLNMYSKDKIETQSESKTPPTKGFLAAAARALSQLDRTAVEKIKTNPSMASQSSKSTAKQELTMLQDLLGMNDSKRTETRGFRINLFPDSTDMKGADSKDGGNFIHFDIDARADAKTLARYMEDLDLNDDASSKFTADEEEDLLSLMDSVK